MPPVGVLAPAALAYLMPLVQASGGPPAAAAARLEAARWAGWCSDGVGKYLKVEGPAQ